MNDFYLGQTGTLVKMVKFDDVPFTGATVKGDYYKPDDSVFLSAQPFTEVGATGVYYDTFNIPSDAVEGVYKAKIEAIKGLASDSFVDTFTEADGPASLWTPAGGNWEIQSGVYRQTYQQSNPYFSAAGEFGWRDITYEADVKGVSGFNYEGIAFHFNHIEDSYVFYLRTGSGNVRLMKAPFITLVQTATNSITILPDTYYRLKVVMTGANIKCYVDNQLQIEYDDPNPIIAGRIGLWAYWTDCWFDNVDVTIPGLEIKSYTAESFRVKAAPGTIEFIAE